jgi:hypothetical protein
MLSNSVYCGIIKKDGKKYTGSHKPIVSKKLFDDAQRVAERTSRPKSKKLHFTYRGILKCSNCGCNLTASLKKGKHVYYYCTNGKGGCNEHKNYLREEDVSEELGKMFREIKFDEKIIDLCYKAKMEELETDNNYFTKVKNDLEKRLEEVKKRKNSLLDLFIDGKIEKDVYDDKKQSLDNEEVEMKQEINELKTKYGRKGEKTLERTKKILLYPIQGEKRFLEADNSKKAEIAKNLLWNASFENKKIANFGFKEPYNLLSEVPNKSDFYQLLGVVDGVRKIILDEDINYLLFIYRQSP